MKRSLFSITLLAVSAAVITRADDVLPKRFDLNRYSAMVENSPFAVASAPAQVSTTPSWSKDLFIANALHMEQIDLVTINSLSDKNLKEYLTTEGPNDHGYGIASIEWSQNPGATKVTISKDGQFATIGFNEAIMSQAPVPNVPQQPNIPGGAKSGAQTGVQPMNTSPAAMPSPHVRGIIQRKPQQPPPPPAPNTAPMTAPEANQ